MTSSFHIPRVKVEVATQLKDFKTPLEKIDYLEILAYEIRDKLDAMLTREGRAELARTCFEFLPTRAELDMTGWGEEDIFSH